MAGVLAATPRSEDYFHILLEILCGRSFSQDILPKDAIKTS